MKVVYKKEDHDSKTKFESLKPGDLFSFGDPAVCKSEVFLKMNPSKDQGSVDVVNLDTGKFGSYYNIKRETVTSDQEYVYKLDAQLVVST